MVNEEEFRISWASSALNSFKKACSKIQEESPRSAQKIRLAILDRVSYLKTNPFVHPPNRFKTDNQGQYRAFEIFRFTVTYKVEKQQVFILRFRHTSRKPIDY